ncbi:RlpA-like double-psi beta-barrel-protein domain-containing protein-containing protein [Mycena vulgaris]|nr:RlpA-like double-psi beta-barrel-protein domain-containing protein-containing protein [Mycena vulgaris]
MLHFSHYSTDSHSPLATYYDPNGGTGACPPYLSLGNNDLIVALGSGHWNGGSHCGETMTVTYGSNTVNVVVQDLCPGCQGANGIDLTPGAISQLDSNYVNDGVITVTWSLPTLP